MKSLWILLFSLHLINCDYKAVNIYYYEGINKALTFGSGTVEWNPKFSTSKVLQISLTRCDGVIRGSSPQAKDVEAIPEFIQIGQPTTNRHISYNKLSDETKNNTTWVRTLVIKSRTKFDNREILVPFTFGHAINLRYSIVAPLRGFSTKYKIQAFVYECDQVKYITFVDENLKKFQAANQSFSDLLQFTTGVDIIRTIELNGEIVDEWNATNNTVLANVPINVNGHEQVLDADANNFGLSGIGIYYYQELEKLESAKKSDPELVWISIPQEAGGSSTNKNTIFGKATKTFIKDFNCWEIIIDRFQVNGKEISREEDKLIIELQRQTTYMYVTTQIPSAQTDFLKLNKRTCKTTPWERMVVTDAEKGPASNSVSTITAYVIKGVECYIRFLSGGNTDYHYAYGFLHTDGEPAKSTIWVHKMRKENKVVQINIENLKLFKGSDFDIALKSKEKYSKPRNKFLFFGENLKWVKIVIKQTQLNTLKNQIIADIEYVQMKDLEVGKKS